MDLRAITPDMQLWLAPLILILGCGLVGILVEKVVLARLRAIVRKAPWEPGDIVINALRGFPILWFLLLGGYLAVLNFQFPPTIEIHAERIFLVLFLISLIVVVARICGQLVTYAAKHLGTAATSSSFLVHIAEFAVYALGLLAVLQTVGISILPVLAALGVGGLAVSLALQDSLSNLFAGLQIILSRQIRPGDFIRLESGQEGYVMDISLRNTLMRQLANNIVIVPNAKLASSIVTNFHSADPEVSVQIQVGIGYDSDLERTETIAKGVGRAVMQEVEGGIPGFEPVVHFQSFGESGIQMSLSVQGQEYVNQFVLKHELVKRLKQRFQEEGIEMAFPVRTIYLKHNTPTSLNPQ